MPKYESVELLCALMTGFGLKLLVAVIYRAGSKAAADYDFFNDLSDIVERLSHYSTDLYFGISIWRTQNSFRYRRQTPPWLVVRLDTQL